MTIRVHQKDRTRAALIEAARRLFAAGDSPTVEDAAAAARISRTTAYRYFKNQAELLAVAHPETNRTSLLPARAPADVHARVDAVVRGIVRIVLTTEAQQRTLLRVSLETGRQLPLRQGRAIGWFEDALAPLAPRWSKARRRRLAIALRTTVGIEAFVWLTDVAGLSRARAASTMRWSAATLLRGALADDGARRR
jgi:AcrR family transcriptional regulator